jgi:NAD(P)-dependent dehydrogenase (short-subunit alcohol dehydrogenase family)
MSSNLFDLSGKVTLVTGGNGGLGLGFARGIAKQGGDLEIWGRSAEKNSRARQELEAFGVRVITREVDVASEQAVIDGYNALMDDFGRIDCVIANSGIPAMTRSILQTTSEDYHSLLNVNMHGAFFTLREGARHMVARAEAGEPGGSLIFCSSLSMFQGIAGKGQYAAAKAGIGALIRCMAVELGKYGIRANSIAPGYIKTEMTGSAEELSPIDQYFAAKSPIPRPGYPADFEGIAAYLASDASSFHSGDTIVIDGACLINL